MPPEMMLVKNNSMVMHWSLEEGYDKGVHKDEYPMRIFNARPGDALNINLKLFERDLEYLCRGSVQVLNLLN